MIAERTHTDIENRVINFLLLNASFSDKLGPLDGKTAAAVYLFNVQPHQWVQQAAYSLMEESIMQINLNTPLTFGNGVTGIGAVLEYLNKAGFIEEDTNELLETCEPYILSAVYGGKVPELGMANGITGFGLYLLHRLQASPPAHPFQQLRMKEAVIACIDHVSNNMHLCSSTDLSIFNGLGGILLWLHQVKTLGWQEPVTSELISQLTSMVLMRIIQEPFSWEHAESWFSLLYCGAVTDNNTLAELERWLYKAGEQLHTLTFHNTAWTALWLQLTGYETQLSQAFLLSDQLKKQVTDIISHSPLPDHFPFHIGENTVRSGMQEGVCGIALPLMAIEKSSYGWLSVFGIHKLYGTHEI